jgi:hypothetical protein
MKHLKRYGLVALTAGLALATAGASSASALALPEILPLSTLERDWTGGSDSSPTQIELLNASFNISCKQMPTTAAEFAGKPLGPIHIEFKECKSSMAVACTGLGDAAGVILVLGQWHLVFDKISGELLPAKLFLFETIHFSCAALVLVIVTGELVCLDLEATVSKTTHLYHCIVEGSGSTERQQDKAYFNETGQSVPAELACSINEAAAAPCFALWLATTIYSEPVDADI